MFVAVDHCTTECIAMRPRKALELIRGRIATLRGHPRRRPRVASGTTTGPTTWLMTSNSAFFARATRASPKATASPSVR